MTYEELMSDIKLNEDLIDAIKERKKELDSKLKFHQKIVDESKESYKELMLSDGVMSDENYTITKGRESLIVHDVEALPEEFVRIKKEADKKAITAFLKDGNKVNYATLERGDDYLTKSRMKGK